VIIVAHASLAPPPPADRPDVGVEDLDEPLHVVTTTTRRTEFQDDLANSYSHLES
jgi:hypothetical protein